MTQPLSKAAIAVVDWVPIKPPGLPPWRIAMLITHYSHIAVQHALLELVDAGLVRFDGPDGARTYYRASP
jgi:hypothetical protein